MADYNGMLNVYKTSGYKDSGFILINRPDVIEMETIPDYLHSPHGISHKIRCTDYAVVKPNSRIYRVLEEEVKRRSNNWITHNPFEIDRVLYSGPATIVFWTDGTKTVVKCWEKDDYSPETGLAMAISKKVLGDRYSNIFRKYCVDPEEYDIEVSVDEDNHTVVKKL